MVFYDVVIGDDKMEHNKKTKLIPLNTLRMQLINQLRERNYAESTIHCIEVEAECLQDYLFTYQLNGYSPQLGNAFLKDFIENKEYAKKTLANYISLIRRLDDLYLNRPFLWRHSSKKSEIPEWGAIALSKHLEKCKENGNTEKSIIRKETACRKFFIRLHNSGCRYLTDVTSEKVQLAILAENNDSAFGFVREMLCFFAKEGLLIADYSTLIPKVHRKIKVPSTYEKVEVEKAEKSIDTTTAIGKRDYAILLLSTRLGLRAGDIAGICFSHIDFDRNRLCFIQEKTKHPIELELPLKVREALCEYIENGRPMSTSDFVFLSFKNPYRVIDRTLVHHITTQCLDRAGINYTGKKHGPHSFRSSLATAMVNNGMSYDMTRKALGHADPESIKHYASLDIENLRNCTIEVPEPNGCFKKLLSGKESE